MKHFDPKALRKQVQTSMLDSAQARLFESCICPDVIAAPNILGITSPAKCAKLVPDLVAVPNPSNFTAPLTVLNSTIYSEKYVISSKNTSSIDKPQFKGSIIAQTPVA